MSYKKEKIIFAILLLIIIWFGATIVRLENYHYAVQVGLCQEYSSLDIKKDECLNKSETRTSWMWHLLYGLGI